MFAAASKSGRASGGGPGPTPTDANFGYVPLLLETGSSSSLNTTVTDSSASPNTVTRTANPSTGWVSPYQTDGYWGNQFNGSSTLNLATNAIPASGAFTFETFVYPTGTAASQVIAAQYPNGSASGRLMILWNDTANKFTVVLGASVVFVSDATYSANAWLYLVVQRDASNVWSMYVNGTRNSATVTNATAIDTAVTYIGNRNTGGTPYTGYISNLRVVTSALYSGSTISVPTTPFSVSTTNQVLLTCYSNRFIDANTATTAKVITVTGTPQVNPYFYPSGFTAPAASPGAVLFNGTNQFLKSTTATTAFQFGTGPFTIEGWIYRTPKALRQYICGGSFSGPGFQLAMDSPGFFIYGGVTGIGNLPFSTITVTENAWTHFAVVRTSTSASGAAYYINGVPAGTFTISSNISGTASFINVGTSNDSTAEPTSGYIANFRSVKGTAVYTGAFTPPSGPLTQNGGTYPSLTNVVTGFSAANTTLLLAMSDSNYTSATNGVQNNTFIDDSNYAFPITRNGTPTQGSITPYWPNGQWSNFFNGSSGYISTPNATSLQLNSSLWTIEGWFYVTSAAGTDRYLLVQQNGTVDANLNWFLRFTTANVVRLAVVTNVSVAVAVDSTTTVNPNTWYHIAASCDGAGAGANLRLWVNGIYQAGTTFNSAQLNTNAASTTVMSWPSASLFTAGYVSNVRILKGTALYTGTGAITVPTTPLTAITNTSLLTCQSNRFLDTNTQLTPKTITPTGTPTVQAFQPFSPTASYTTALYGGSGYFGGSPSYLSFPVNSAMNFGTGDFTVEAWVYPTATPGDGAGPIGGATSNILFAYSASAFPGKWAFGRNNVAFDFSSLTDIVLNTWTHLAVSRSSGTIRFFINGALTNSASNSNSYILTGGGNIGFNGASSYFTGYMSQIRAVGTAVYTGAFTPPTLAPISTTGPASAASYSSTTNVNTTFLTPASLLLNMTNAGIYDAAVQNNAITAGDAKTDTTIYKWPSTASVKFDGTGDYLSIPDSPVFAFGTGNFTVECWIYPTSVANEAMIAGQWSGSTGSTTLNWALMFSAGSTGYLRFITSSNGSSVLFDLSTSTTSFTISLNVWQYIAVVRNGSTFTLYVDGVSRATTTNASGLFDATNVFTVGAESDTPSQFFNGYIQDLRITKGVARTITTPTAAFPTR